jgi:hypothetical protein
MLRRTFSSLPLAAAAAPLLPTRGELDLYIQRFEKTLVENILGFWSPKTIDPAGGYLLNHDLGGSRRVQLQGWLSRRRGCCGFLPGWPATGMNRS